jgi:hypothetical protein
VHTFYATTDGWIGLKRGIVMAEQLTGDHHYIVISSDNHGGADILGYKPYLAAKWHEEFDAWAASYTNPWDFVDPRLKRDDFRVDKTGKGPGSREETDPDMNGARC